MNQSINMPLKIDRAVIEINGGCNYTCQMCPQTEGRGRDWLRKMSLVDFERIVAECAEHGLRIVNLEGSGEPTLNSNLPEYIAIVKKYGAQAIAFSNGYKMSGDFMRDCVDAGLDFFRFSVIGYNAQQYAKWMAADNFDTILNNARNMSEYVQHINSNCTVASYHLILDPTNIEYELQQYQDNFITPARTKAEIWHMHNWSGVYDTVTFKRRGQRRSCGRPFSPDLTVRAGGNAGHRLSVAPCCQTLGRDSEAVLGNLDDQTLAEVWNGERYQWLRQKHMNKEFDDVSFCKNCDFLYDDPSVLVWSNHDRQLHKMIGTEFSLNEFRN
jgi:MoaA/NifB/PqqE/SkfB family radical SAM enzyme